MKPARSPMVTPTLRSRVASAATSSTTDWSVTTVRTISTSFMTGAGLKKCIPTTRSGRPLVMASSVTDRLEVFVARIVSGGQMPCSCERTAVLSSVRSGTASTTSSTSARSSIEVVKVIRSRIASRSSAPRRPRSTARCVDFSTCPRPRTRASPATSTAVTVSPARANTSTMPAPMVPRPTTPTAPSSLAMLLLPRSEQPRGRVVGALEDGVVDGAAVDAAVGGEHAGLRLDLLGREHPADRRQQRVAVEQLEVAGQLLDAVDLPAPLDLHGHRRPVGVAAQQVDRADRG